MTTISVPLPKELLKFIDDQIKAGVAENRSQAVRQALRKISEEKEIEEILKASKEARKGIYYEGDLKDILKKYRKSHPHA